MLWTSTRSRWAISVLLCLIAAFGMFQLSGWRSDILGRDAIQRDEIRRFAKAVSELEKEQSALPDIPELTLSWDAAQIGAATARIQSHINALSQQSGIELRSVSPIAVQNSVVGNSMGFRVEFEAPLDRTTAFLSSIEYNAPALIVTRGNLRRLVRPGQTGPQPLIFAQLDVTAPVTVTGTEP